MGLAPRRPVRLARMTQRVVTQHETAQDMVQAGPDYQRAR